MIIWFQIYDWRDSMDKIEVAKMRLDKYIEHLEQTRLVDYWTGRDENVLQLMYLLKDIIDNYPMNEEA